MIRNIIVAGALLGMSTAAVAGPAEGNWEIVFTNMGANLSIADGDTVAWGGVRAGKFLWGSNHEFGGSANVYISDATETLGIGGFYRHNWATVSSQKWWYAGVDLDIGDVEEAGDSLWLRPHVGHKWMLTDDVAFDLDAGVRLDLDNSDNDPTIAARWGITVFFK